MVPQSLKHLHPFHVSLFILQISDNGVCQCKYRQVRVRAALHFTEIRSEYAIVLARSISGDRFVCGELPCARAADGCHSRSRHER